MDNTKLSQPSVPLCAPELGGNEWKYIKDCLDTGWVSSVGSYVTAMEQRVAETVGQHHAVATTSGTAALHLALLLAGVQAGQEVLVSDLTFVAPVNVVRYLNAEPVLVDCDPTSMQMDTGLVSQFLRQNCQIRSDGCYNRDTGRRVAAVIPVHLLGHPMDIDPLMEVCQEFSVPVIEDATESLGALYKGGPVGRHGLISCYSFNGNKIVTAGGGGILATSDAALAERGRYLSTQAKDDALYYVHNEVGYNYRLTNIQAAMAVAQLEQLPHFVSAKRDIAHRYNQQFESLAELIQLPQEQPWARSTFWLYTVSLRGQASRQRDPLLKHLNQQGIQARPLWHPIHLNPPFAGCRYLSHGQAHSVDLVDRSISLPSSVGLSPDQQTRVVSSVVDFLKGLNQQF